MARFDEHALEAWCGDWLCVGADGGDLESACNIARDEIEISVRFVADEKWLARDERAECAANTASAVGLECLQVH